MRSVVKHYGLKSTGKTRKVGGKRKISLMTGEVVSFDSGRKIFLWELFINFYRCGFIVSFSNCQKRKKLLILLSGYFFSELS